MLLARGTPRCSFAIELHTSYQVPDDVAFDGDFTTLLVLVSLNSSTSLMSVRFAHLQTNAIRMQFVWLGTIWNIASGSKH